MRTLLILAVLALVGCGSNAPAPTVQVDATPVIDCNYWNVHFDGCQHAKILLGRGTKYRVEGHEDEVGESRTPSGHDRWGGSFPPERIWRVAYETEVTAKCKGTPEVEAGEQAARDFITKRCAPHTD